MKACAKFYLFCGNGKVVLPILDKLPELLDHLLTTTNNRGNTSETTYDHTDQVLRFVPSEQISRKTLLMLDVVNIPSIFRALCTITMKVWFQFVMSNSFGQDLDPRRYSRG